ncbi:MAG: transposase [Clostridia bacterium]
MPRQAREKGEFSTYHVIQRGNERKDIFLSEDDKARFIEILLKTKNKYNFQIYAYCLMDNHVHLVIYDNGNDISQLLKSINISYALYFNRIYKRVGHLFQDRFKSELIQDDRYLLEVSKYIHNNPIKAGMVGKAGDYLWSSYNTYLRKYKTASELVDIYKILGIISNSRNKAVEEYIHYVTKQDEISSCVMDIDQEDILKDHGTHEFIYTTEQAEKWMIGITNDFNCTYEDCINDKNIRNEIIKQLRTNSSLTLKQIGELFGGISQSRVSRILGKK